jgi:hypothetical protein
MILVSFIRSLPDIHLIALVVSKILGSSRLVRLFNSHGGNFLWVENDNFILYDLV